MITIFNNLSLYYFASPKRLSALQGTEFCRMGGSRNRWKYALMVKVQNGTYTNYYHYPIAHRLVLTYTY